LIPPNQLSLLQVIKGLDIGGYNGGSEKFGLELSQHLAKEGVQVYLLAFQQHHTPTERRYHDILNEKGVEILYGPQSITGGMIPYLRDISAFCKEKQIKIIHSHFQVGSLVSTYLRISKAVPIAIRTAHISQEWGRGLIPWLARRIFTDWIFPILLDAEVGVSDAIRTQLERHPGSWLMKKKPSRIYNGLPETFFDEVRNSDTVAALPASGTGDFIIGSIGRLTRRKGYRYLLAAIHEVSPEIPQLRVWLIGDGEERSWLEREAQRLGIEQKVLFLGQRSDVIQLIKQMDVFVLPSLDEGLPTAILESMACKVPVIATDIPGTREIVTSGFNGWLIPPKDIRALGGAIIETYQLPELREAYAKNAVQQLDTFSIRSITRQYLDLYTHLLGKRSAA